MQNYTVKLLCALLSVCIIAMLAGCGAKPIKEESVLDTPDNHYSQGMRELDRGNLDTAVEEFQRAMALEPDYAEAYSGMALVYAEQGNFKEALDAADKGIGKNKNSMDARIAKGIVLTKQRKGDDWVEKAVKEFERAADINPRSDKPHFYTGMAYKEGYFFSDAANSFSKVIEIKGDYAADANEQWELVQKIQRAAPGTKVGKEIALIEEIDRADLAVLLMEELKLLEILEKKREKVYDTGFKAPDDPTKMAQPEAEKLADATDIADHWARNWIKDILEARGMDAFPDHTFRPDEKITRSNYAMIMQNIMIMATGGKTAPENETPAVARPRAWPRLMMNQLLTAVLATIPP